MANLSNCKLWFWCSLITIHTVLAVMNFIRFITPYGEPAVPAKMYMITDGKAKEQLHRNISLRIEDSEVLIGGLERSRETKLKLDDGTIVEIYFATDDMLGLERYSYVQAGERWYGLINRPDSPGSSLRMQRKVINDFEQQVLAGVTFSSKTSHFEDCIDYLDLLIFAPAIAFYPLTLVLSIRGIRREIALMEDEDQ
ncbi:MAG: hypothetical protein IKR25_11685 [Muribaculaceae bacterium]|nr:hypothetical protein [Muribaculaceae bacterium]